MNVTAVQTGQPYAAPAPRRPVTAGDPDADLLSILPDSIYGRDWLRLTRSGREVYLINEPNGIREVLVTQEENFPKSDLMNAALAPLLGEGILISNGDVWARQRTMLEPAFARMHVQRQFPVMTAAVADLVKRLERFSDGSEFHLDAEIGLFALDVIFRAIFSRPIAADEMREVFDAFSAYQDLAPRDESYAMFVAGAGAPPDAKDTLRAFGRRIHRIIEDQIERRLASRSAAADDMLQELMAARDPATGANFSRKELLDQIAVLFLAGHETTASALTWCLFLVSQQPELAEQIRRDADALAPGRPLIQRELARLADLRNAFRETLRLYPASAFFTRTAKRDTRIGALDIEANSLIIVSPWLIQRHEKYWQAPKCFDIDRFSAERERDIIPGTYIPFGLGPRVCTGRALAMNEGPLVVAELLRNFRFNVIDPENVVPSYRLVVKSKRPIRCRIERLGV